MALSVIGKRAGIDAAKAKGVACARANLSDTSAERVAVRAALVCNFETFSARMSARPVERVDLRRRCDHPLAMRSKARACTAWTWHS